MRKAMWEKFGIERTETELINEVESIKKNYVRKPEEEEERKEWTDEQWEQFYKSMVTKKKYLLTKMDKKQYLAESPFRSKSKQATSSMNLRQLLETIEMLIDTKTNVPQTGNTDQFISDFIAEIWNQIENYDFEEELAIDVMMHDYRKDDNANKLITIKEKGYDKWSEEQVFQNNKYGKYIRRQLGIDPPGKYVENE